MVHTTLQPVHNPYHIQILIDLIESEYENGNFSDAAILAQVLSYEFGLTLTEKDVVTYRETLLEEEEMQLIYKHYVAA